MTSFDETAQSLQLLIKHRTARLVARTFHGPEHAISEYAPRHHHLAGLQAIALRHAPIFAFGFNISNVTSRDGRRALACSQHFANKDCDRPGCYT
jgi:hypothetical protein